MTQAEDITGRNIPEGESAIGRKADLDATFAALVRQLGHDLQEEPSESEVDYDATLDFLSKHTIKEMAVIVRDSLITERVAYAPYAPAEPSDVIKYLRQTMWRPPLRINDIGSVDIELVGELELSESHYIEEVRQLLAFVDPEEDSVSVLDLPKLRQRMIEDELAGLEKTIIMKILDEHGVSYRIDREDQAAWRDLGLLAENLADEGLRPYSTHLRAKKAQGSWTPIRDVIETAEERREIRRRALTLAIDNQDLPAHERERLIQVQQPVLRPIMREVFEYLDGQPEEA